MADSSLQDRIQVFRNMLAADPENELANFTLGKLYVESGDLENAEKTLRKTLELNPQHSMSYRLLGQLLIETERQDEAIDLLEKGIGLAHAKGDYQPRNQMQELLRNIGITPPDPVEEQRLSGGGAGEEGWICSRCGRGNARLQKAPMPQELGQRIYETICQPCWQEWMAMSIKVINEYRLNLADDQGAQIYDSHMKEFLGIEA